MGLYVYYICKGCRKTTILLTEELERTIESGKYISCSHCGCRKLYVGGETDDLRECMKERKYKRNSRGALEQI